MRGRTLRKAPKPRPGMGWNCCAASTAYRCTRAHNRRHVLCVSRLTCEGVNDAPMLPGERPLAGVALCDLARNSDIAMHRPSRLRVARP